MFLTDIHFKKQLHVSNKEASFWFFGTIEKKLKKLKVDKIFLTGNQINFKNSLFNEQGNWHLMAGIDSGNFNYDPQTSTLIYCISTLRIFIFAFIASCIFALFSSSIYTGLIVYLWFYVMNRIISTIRHKKFLNELIMEIEIAENNRRRGDSFGVLTSSPKSNNPI